jgi:hypothetical protein
MKNILLIPCVLCFLGVVDVVDGADKHLRGLSRNLQYGGFGGDNDTPFLIVSPPKDPTQSSTSASFQSSYQTPEDNAPVSGNDEPNQTEAPVSGTNLDAPHHQDQFKPFTLVNQVDSAAALTAL